MPTQDEINVGVFESVIKVAAHGGPLPLPWGGQVRLARVKANPGDWYFGVECPKCKRTSAAFRDWSDGKLGNCFHGSGDILLGCHFCPNQICAQASKIVTFRSQ